MEGTSGCVNRRGPDGAISPSRTAPLRILFSCTANADTKPAAQEWARQVENLMDRREWVDRTEGHRTLLSMALERYKREIFCLARQCRLRRPSGIGFEHCPIAGLPGVP